MRFEGASYPGHDLIQNDEDLVQVAVELVGPQLRARSRIDEVDGGAEAIVCYQHSAFQHGRGIEASANLAHVKPFPVQGEDGRSSNQMKTGDASQTDEYFGSKALTEIILFRVGAHIREGEDGDSRGWQLRICAARAFGRCMQVFRHL